MSHNRTPDLQIIKGTGGLGRPLKTNEGISGLIFYSTGLTDASIVAGSHEIFSVQDISTVLGVTGDTIAGGAILDYTIREYFRQSQSSLFVSIADSGNTNSFEEIITLKNFSNGAVKQIGIYDEDDFTTASLTSIQIKVDKAQTEYMPLIVAYSAPLALGETVESISTANDLTTLNAPGVTYTIGEDRTAGSRADVLRTSGATLVGNIGTELGSISKALVHESIAWSEKFPLVGTDFQTPGFIDGSLYKDKSLTFIDNLATKSFHYLKKWVGDADTYHGVDYTSVAATSDFSDIQSNRTWNSAFRRLYNSLIKKVNSPLTVDASGNLEQDTVKLFETIAGDALKVMKDAGEISDYRVDIDPDQDVLSTSKIEITAFILPIGTARFIEVTLGFTSSIQ